MAADASGLRATRAHLQRARGQMRPPSITYPQHSAQHGAAAAAAALLLSRRTCSSTTCLLSRSTVSLWRASLALASRRSASRAASAAACIQPSMPQCACMRSTRGWMDEPAGRRRLGRQGQRRSDCRCVAAAGRTGGWGEGKAAPPMLHAGNGCRGWSRSSRQRAPRGRPSPPPSPLTLHGAALLLVGQLEQRLALLLQHAPVPLHLGLLGLPLGLPPGMLLRLRGARQRAAGRGAAHRGKGSRRCWVAAWPADKPVSAATRYHAAPAAADRRCTTARGVHHHTTHSHTHGELCV